MNPNSLANLPPHQYPKGTNGNAGGNGYSLLAELKHALNKEKRLKLVESTIQGAILREPTPFKEVWDRIEGKTPDNQPSVAIDNRQIHIHVMDEETKQLLLHIGERTRGNPLAIEEKRANNAIKQSEE